MSTLRDNLEAGLRDYQAARFDGDLAAVLVEESPPTVATARCRFVMAAASLAALAAGIALVVAVSDEATPESETTAGVAQQTPTPPTVGSMTTVKTEPKFKKRWTHSPLPKRVAWLSPKKEKVERVSLPPRKSLPTRLQATTATGNKRLALIGWPRGALSYSKTTVPKTDQLPSASRQRLIATAPVDASAAPKPGLRFPHSLNSGSLSLSNGA